MPALRTPPDDRLVAVAAALQRLRLQRNLTQRGLAERAKIGHSTVSQIEAYTFDGLPSADKLAQLATGLATDGHGSVDLEYAREAHEKLMLAIGYIKHPTRIQQFPIPQEVVALIQENADIELDMGIRDRPWTADDIENIRRAFQLVRRNRNSRGGTH